MGLAQPEHIPYDKAGEDTLFLLGELKGDEFCPLGESADDGIGAVGLDRAFAGSDIVLLGD